MASVLALLRSSVFFTSHAAARFFFEVCLNNLFDWYWTGFKGNKLWNWLSMLLIPVVLTTATIWFTAPCDAQKARKSAIR